MIANKEQISTLFREFYAFLENAGLLYLKDGKEVEKRYNILSDAFKDKIRRCELENGGLLPDQIAEQVYIFEVLTEIVKNYFCIEPYLKFNPYVLESEEEIVELALEKYQERNQRTAYYTAPDLVLLLVDSFIDYVDCAEDIPFETIKNEYRQTILPRLAKEKLGYDYPGELLTDIFGVLYERFKDFCSHDINERQFIEGVVSDLCERGLVHLKFVYEIIANLTYKFLHFLEKNGYLKYMQGVASKTHLPFKNAVEAFRTYVGANGKGQSSQDMVSYFETVADLVNSSLENGTIVPQEIINNAYYSVYSQIRNSSAWSDLNTEENLSDLKRTNITVQSAQETEILRTYKVGLRAPNSLLDDFNDFVRRCEVLAFFKKFFDPKLREKLVRRGVKRKDFKGFKNYKNLTNASNSKAIKAYKELFDQYAGIKSDLRAVLNAYNEVMFKIKLRQRVKDHLGVVGEFFSINIRTMRKKLGKKTPKYNFTEFKAFYNLENGSNELFKKYKSVFEPYKGLGLKRRRKELLELYEEIFKKYVALGRNKAKRLLSSDFPHIQNTERPLPFEISLGEYQYRANRSFKMACAHFNTIAEENIESVPEEKEELLDQAVFSKGVNENDLLNGLKKIKGVLDEIDSNDGEELKNPKNDRSPTNRLCDFILNASKNRKEKTRVITKKVRKIIRDFESCDILKAQSRVEKGDAESFSLRGKFLKFLVREAKEQQRRNFRNFPERAISSVLGFSGNYDLIAFKHMASAMDAYRDTREKVQRARKLLFLGSDDGPDFSDDRFVFMAYYSIPNRLKNYLAQAWGVDAEWVRNQMVGWRRKVDSILPIKFQVEPLTELFTRLADYYIRKYARDDDAVKRAIFSLQDKHVLHLLSEPIDLSVLLDGELKDAYTLLKQIVEPLPNALQQEVDKYITEISRSEFIEATRMLVHNVRTTIARLYEAFEGESESRQRKLTRAIKNCEAFGRKVELLRECALDSRTPLAVLLKNFLAGNRYTGSAVNLIKHLPMVKKRRITRLFTALRGVVALAFAKIYDEASAQFESAFNPDNCVSLPFTSPNRKKKYLPANLLDKKYIALHCSRPPRTGEKPLDNCVTNQEATEFLKQGEPTWLGIPLYNPEQLIGGKIVGNRKGLFWFQLIPSSKVRECLSRGAELKSIRLNVPRGPTNKIEVDLTLSSSNREAFLHRGYFIEQWDCEFDSIDFPQNKYIGSDFNRIGKYSVAVGTPNREIDLTRDSSVIKSHEDAYEKLEQFRTHEIPGIQRKIEAIQNTLDLVIDPEMRKNFETKLGRLKTGLTLLHRKRQNVMEEKKRETLMIYLFAGYKTKANYFAWDSVQGISTRGKKDTLANAVTYMPKRKELLAQFTSWAEDLKHQGLMPNYEATVSVSPFHSDICGDCFARTGERRKTRDKTRPYHDFWCTDLECGKQGNRHSNSGQVSALELQYLIEQSHIT